MKKFKFFDDDKELILSDWVWVDPNYHNLNEWTVEDIYYPSFIDFLRTFPLDVTIVIRRVRLRYEDNSYLDIVSENYLSYLDSFTSHEGEVKVEWLNFRVL